MPKSSCPVNQGGTGKWLEWYAPGCERKLADASIGLVQHPSNRWHLPSARAGLIVPPHQTHKEGLTEIGAIPAFSKSTRG